MKISTNFSIFRALPSLAAFFFVQLLSGSVWASSFYAWDDAGYCIEYASNGSIVTSDVDADKCRASQGSHYAWDDAGYCDEYASNGSIVTSHSNYDKCRKSQGSHYAWDHAGYCDEFASNGTIVISHLNNDRCRATATVKKLSVWGYFEPSVPNQSFKFCITAYFASSSPVRTCPGITTNGGQFAIEAQNFSPTQLEDKVVAYKYELYTDESASPMGPIREALFGAPETANEQHANLVFKVRLAESSVAESDFSAAKTAGPYVSAGEQNYRSFAPVVLAK